MANAKTKKNDVPISHTLLSIKERFRPDDELACTKCAQAMWLSTSEQAKCYCRIMQGITWPTTDALPIVNCDGQATASTETIPVEMIQSVIEENINSMEAFKKMVSRFGISSRK